MKKIPCLFVREFRPRPNGHGQEAILTREVTPGLERALNFGKATHKWDGTACMVKDGRLYKRYDAKNGKPAPADGIPCDEPDPTTGHWPHWVPVGDEPASKWHREAWERQHADLDDGTYELVGPHFAPHQRWLDGEPISEDTFVEHGEYTYACPRNFDGLRDWLKERDIEGIVFWLDGEPRCKIRRSDFGFTWGGKR